MTHSLKIFANKKTRGFSLIELVVVLSIIGILLPPIMNPMFTIFVNRERNVQLDHAQNLAEKKLEELHNTAFAQIINVSATSFPEPFSGFRYKIDTDFVDGPYALDTVSAGSSNYKKTRITVTTPANTEYQLVTLFTNHEFK